MLIGLRNLSLKIFYLVRISILSRISGIYELCAHTMSGSESKWNDLMRDMLMGKEESHQGTLLGAWKAQAGGVMNTIYHLWHYPDLDNRFSTLITAVLQFPLPFHPAFLVFYSVSVCIPSFLWKYSFRFKLVYSALSIIYHANRIRSSTDAAQNPDYVLTKEALLPFCSNYWTKILNPAPWSPMK